ncbi:hypothetical protein OQA88_2159 [Cercophora sp. LCS_1]
MLPTVLNLVTCALATLSSPVHGLLHDRHSKLPLPARIVYRFPNRTWIENIAVRPNGDLLLTTLLPNASLYTLEDPQSPRARPRLLHTFDVDSLLGIAESRPDKFVVVGGDFSSRAVGVPGTFAAWTVDFGSQLGSHPRIRKAANIREAVFLNGVTELPGCGEVLIADSALGRAWRLDVETGKYTVGIQVPEMAPVPDAPLKIGINGIHFFKGFVYWTNSFEATLYRIKVGYNGHPTPGSGVEKVAKVDVAFLDDFTFDYNATAWATTHLDNKLVAIKPNGAAVVVEGSAQELTVAGDTACHFGRTEKDRKVLYIVTDGGIASPVNGTMVEGGKVVAVDTSGF